MMSIQNVLRTIALALATLILASCVVEVDDSQPVRPGFCTREYNPVCGARGTREKTFSNGCEARQAGWAIIGRGECRNIIVEPPRTEPLLCPQIYQPVCATRRGRTQTFGNSCEADASGWNVISRGECERTPIAPDRFDPPIIREQPRSCTKEFRPVCAVRGNREQTFANSCIAESEGWRIVADGEC